MANLMAVAIRTLLIAGMLSLTLLTSDASISALQAMSATEAPAPRPETGTVATPATPPKAVPAQKRAAPSLAATATRSQQKQRLTAVSAVRNWVVQMQNLDVTAAAAAPADLIVVDATSGASDGRALTQNDVSALKRRPDGRRRLAISYLSIGESEDYRPDYFNSEYMTEDAPDWLLKENDRWKGNRLIRFCEEGWQRTILGDDDGRNVYNSLDPSPLYKLIELGFDGVYLDRVDVYSEVQKECPDSAAKMVDFVARLAAHARKKSPNFIVILQNAEELLRFPKMIDAIDAMAKEDLFYGADHSERPNDLGMVNTVLANLAYAKAAGRPVFVLDYIHDPATRAADKAKIEAQGFIPYFGPRKLDQLWLPGTTN
ncbi:MAG: endo alpha-1,4 polygalactosaminidase [Hyphomicrobium sp.]